MNHYISGARRAGHHIEEGAFFDTLKITIRNDQAYQDALINAEIRHINIRKYDEPNTVSCRLINIGKFKCCKHDL